MSIKSNKNATVLNVMYELVLEHGYTEMDALRACACNEMTLEHEIKMRSMTNYVADVIASGRRLASEG